VNTTDEDRDRPEKETAGDPGRERAAEVTNDANSLPHCAQAGVFVEKLRPLAAAHFDPESNLLAVEASEFDFSTAVAFARAMIELCGSIQVVHIHRDGKTTAKVNRPSGKGKSKTPARLFDARSTDDEIRSYVAHNRDGWNTYWSVNTTTAAVEKGAKEDVTCVRMVHVDADGDRATSARRLHELGMSFGIDSGNGLWGFRLLYEPIQLDPDSPPYQKEGPDGAWLKGDFAKCGGVEQPFDPERRTRLVREVEARNRHLKDLFKGGDSAQNVDRIARMPGTINWPNATKLAKGCKPAVPRLVVPDGPVRLFKFDEMPATYEERPKSKSGGGTEVNVSGGRRHVDLDTLPKELDQRVKVVIQQGRDEDQPLKNKDQSRSAWLLFAVGSLVRAKVDDDTIYSIITDRDFGISASVLNKGGPDQVHRYAVRQIKRAKELARTPDWVAEVNRDRFAALDGGKVRFFREEDDGALTTMDKAAFDYDIADRWATEVEDGKPKVFQVSKRWHSNGQRRYYPKGLKLDPESEGDDGEHYNLWKGFSVEPAPGDWSLLRDHFYKVLDKDHADYFIRSMAWKVQNPGVPSRVAIVLRGKEGTGKGMGVTYFTDLFGKHGLRVHSMLHVAGRFNAHQRHLCVLFADEVHVVGKDQVGTLKGLITEKNLPIEGKGVDVVNAENHITVYMVTNEHWAVPAGLDARRFAVFDVKDTVRGKREHFDAIDRQMRSGGLAAMLHDLMHMDLGSWHPEAARPDTTALAEQKAFGLDPIPRLLFQCLQAGQVPFGHRQEDGTVRIGSIQFTDWVSLKTRRDDVTTTMLGVVFARLGFVPFKGKPKGWDIPKLAEARAAWDKTMFPWNWDAQADEQWSIVPPPRRDDPPVHTDAF